MNGLIRSPTQARFPIFSCSAVITVRQGPLNSIMEDDMRALNDRPVRYNFIRPEARAGNCLWHRRGSQ